MKKILKLMTVLLLLALLLFQLTACGTDVPGDQAELPPDSQTEDPTPWPAPIVGQPEEPDTPPETTETEQPTETEPDPEKAARELYDQALAYGRAPDDVLLFVFDGYQPFPWRDALDISRLEEGVLYLFDKKNNVISSTGISGIDCIDHTTDHIYYTVEGDCTQILRTDYSGEEQTVVYETDQKITSFDYSGIDANGILAVVLDEQQVILYHMDTGETEFIMEQYQVEFVRYYNASYGYREPNVGPTLHWRGQPTAEDDGGIDFYAYYIELDEMQAFDFPDD